MLKFEELPEINSKRWLSLENLPYEEWKVCEDTNERFSISNYGRLKRNESITIYPNGQRVLYKERIMRTQILNTGYCGANLSIGNNTIKPLSIHRLVAKAFIENPNNLPLINHKDENPQNNHVANLEWCTPKYNSNYGTMSERLRQHKIVNEIARPIVLYSYEGEKLKEYQTMKDAAIDNNISRGLVEQCCKNIISAAKGLHFRFKDDVYQKRDIIRSKNVYVTTLEDGKEVRFERAIDLCNAIGIKYCCFRGVLMNLTKHSSYMENLNPIDVYTSKNEHFRIEKGYLIKL